MYGHLSSISVTRYLQRFTRSQLPELNCCLILLLMRFAYAIDVTTNAVSSYLTFSPLPIRAVIFCSTICIILGYAKNLTTTKIIPVIIRHHFRRSPDFSSQTYFIIKINCATIYIFNLLITPHNSCFLNQNFHRFLNHYLQIRLQINHHHQYL